MSDHFDYFAIGGMLLAVLLLFGGLILGEVYNTRQEQQTIRICLEAGNPVAECNDLGDD